MIEKAVDCFNKNPNRYNCATDIILAFKGKIFIDKDFAEFKSMGYGRAPEGICGALFAVKYLLKDPKDKKYAEDYFQDEAGSLECRKIRKLKKLTCVGCVETAAHILEELIEKN